jgi:hypothetical protein
MPKKTDQPFYLCPRYDRCSVNNCPLHPKYPNLYIDGADAEKVCDLGKARRQLIAGQFPGMLKYGGLTPREFKAQARWAALTPEERATKIEQSRARLTAYHQACEKAPSDVV